MKFIVATLLSAVLAFAGGLFFEWWVIAITSFVVGLLIHQRALFAFLAGFIGVALLWGGIAAFIDFNNHHILSSKIANLLPLGGSYVNLILATALIGGLVSGFAAITGCYLRPRRKRKVEKVYETNIAPHN